MAMTAKEVAQLKAFAIAKAGGQSAFDKRAAIEAMANRAPEPVAPPVAHTDPGFAEAAALANRPQGGFAPNPNAMALATGTLGHGPAGGQVAGASGGIPLRVNRPMQIVTDDPASADDNLTDRPAMPQRQAQGGGGGGGYAGPAYIGRSWSKDRLPYTDPTMAREERLINNEAKLIEDSQKAAQAQLEAVREAETNKALTLEQHNKAMLAQRAEEEIHKKYQMQELSERQRAVENFELEPDRVFAKASVPFKAGFIIKGMLDGALSGFTGRPNEFGKFADSLIKMDQDKQLAVFDKLKRAEAGTRNAMADYEKITGNKKAAMLQSEVDKLTAIETMMKTQFAKIDAGIPGAQSTMPGVVDTGIKSKSQRIYDAAMQDLEARKIARVKQLEAMQFVPGHLVGGGGGGAKSKANEDRFVRDLDGNVIEMRSDKEAQESRAKVGAVQEIDRLTRQIDEIRSGASAYMPLSETRATLESLGTQLKFAIKNANQTGAIDKGSTELMDQMAGDPTGLFSRAGHKGRVIADMAKKQLKESLSGGYGERVDKGYERAPTGEVKRKSTYKGATANPAVTPQGFKPVGGK